MPRTTPPTPPDHTPGKSRNVTTFAAEDSALERALQSIEDPYGLQELSHFSIDELVDAAERALRYSTVAMIQAGRIYHAIKARMEHGTWEQFVIDHHWSFNYVRGCMKLVEVVAKHPQAALLPPGRVTNQLLHMPMSRIDEVLIELSEDAIKKLTPWELQKIYEEKRKKPQVRKEYPMVEPDFTALDAVLTKAVGLLRELADIEIPPSEYDKAKEWSRANERLWTNALYNISDPGHEIDAYWDALGVDVDAE